MTDPLLEATITVPEHVVRREFPEESIVLNLQTGQYHGLNATAGAMLDALVAGAPAGRVAEQIADQASVPVQLVQDDIVTLMRELADRKLIEIDVAGS